jgi:hypothetical protein
MSLAGRCGSLTSTLRCETVRSPLCQRDLWPEDTDALAELYDTHMNAIFDGLIPSRPTVRRPRSSHTWYDCDCRKAKRLTRRFERANAAAVRRKSLKAAQSHGFASATSVESA